MLVVPLCPPTSPVLFKSQRFLKLMKRRTLLWSVGSEAGLCACWHLGQAHQTPFGARACGYSVMSLPSIDCPAGSSALTLRLLGSGITEVEAECSFVLVSETPEVNLKSWCEHWSTSKYRSLPAALRARKEKNGFFHWEAALGQRVVQNHCLTLERAQNSKGFLQVCSSRAPFAA